MTSNRGSSRRGRRFSPSTCVSPPPPSPKTFPVDLLPVGDEVEPEGTITFEATPLDDNSDVGEQLAAAWSATDGGWEDPPATIPNKTTTNVDFIAPETIGGFTATVDVTNSVGDTGQGNATNTVVEE